MSVLTTSTLVIEDSEKAILVSAKKLEQITYIQYPITFLGNVTQDDLALDPMSALLYLGNEINVMHPAFTERLGLLIQTINLSTQKIDGITFETYEIVVAAFLIIDQADKVRFFEKIFLVANVSPDEVLGMPFFTLSGADVDFLKKKLWWRSYTIKKALLTTKRVELVRKKEFAAAAFDSGHETFIIHVVFLRSLSSTQESDIHHSRRTQIAALVANEALTSISTKYSDFADVFSLELALKLSEYIGINDYTIELVDN